jgi:hypothetical protein
MAQPNIQIVLVFSQEDRDWIRRTSVEVPKFFHGHPVPPALGDVLRIGGRQFTLNARVWEHDGASPVLRLFLGGSHAPSDTSFGDLNT